MTNNDLQQLVETISLKAFAQPFTHQARFNARLQTTGGRFHLQDCHLDFNPHLFAQVSPRIQEGIIKHELCHYHLYRAHRGYQHRDADFKHLLATVGGLRYAPALKQARPRHYRCQACGQDYWRKRRINLARMRCGRCFGQLVFLQGPR